MSETLPSGRELIGHFSAESLIKINKKWQKLCISYAHLMCELDQCKHGIVAGIHTLHCLCFNTAIVRISC